MIGSPGTQTQASFDGVNHTYADNGVYTVTLRVADDDMAAYNDATKFTSGTLGADYVQDTLTVTVNNVVPTLTATTVPQSVNEGTPLTITNIGTITDPGFDNPANPLAQPDGTTELFHYYINWGDGTTSDLGSATVDVIGSPGTQTQASFDGVNHTYADNGVYTVTLRVADDDMAAYNDATKFTSGTLGADYVQDTLTVTVNNVVPTLTATTVPQSVNEGTPLTITNIGTITDPGFDNPANPLAQPDGTTELFHYYINWGDGTTSDLGSATVDVIGSPGTQTQASFDGVNHTYADNGVYTVTLRVADDDMAAYNDATKFTSGTLGADYVQDTLTVTVNNVVPSVLVPGTLTVNEGQSFVISSDSNPATQDLGVLLQDPGFDNPANPLSSPNGSHETFTAMSINWGDGSSPQTLTIDDAQRVSGGIGVTTKAPLDAPSHIYADNGTYTVTITVKDDDMANFTPLQFQIIVENVEPTLASIPVPLTVNEGSPFAISSDVNAPLRVLLQDPGFDNPVNPLSTPIGSSETFFGATVDWGDGTPVGTVTINNALRAVGSPGVMTTVPIDTSQHIYADDGTYNVTIMVRDDDMTGFVARTFTITVNGVQPSFTPQPGGANIVGTQVSPQGFTTIDLAYNDPGFDNVLNPNAAVPPTITDTHHETFTHVVDWGDGTVDAIHTYADNVTHDVTIMRTALGVTETFTISAVGNTGSVLTLVSSQDINNPGAVAQSFTFMIDWDDSNVQTITLMLKRRSCRPSTVKRRSTLW